MEHRRTDTGDTSNIISSLSILHDVPLECHPNVFQFLTFNECMNCLGVNRSTFLLAIHELKRRRDIQFLHPHIEIVRQVETNEGSKIICVDVQPATDYSDDQTYVQPLLISPETKEQRFLLPTIHERIVGLHRSIPVSHPLNDDVRALKVYLETINNRRRRGEENPHDESTSKDREEIIQGGLMMKKTKNHTYMNNISSNSCFGELIELLRDVTLAHRLHASLLKRCTIDLDPHPSSVSIYDQYNHQATPGRNKHDLTVTLDQYMGDVIAAYYLTAHSLAGIVEGGKSFQSWVENDLVLLAQHKDRSIEQTTTSRWKNRNEAPYRWYKLWVFLHSTLLRNLPLTNQQATTDIRLGPPSGISFVHRSMEFAATNNVNNNNNNRELDNVGLNRETSNSAPTMKETSWVRPSLCFSLGVVDKEDILHNNGRPIDWVDQVFGSLADPLAVGMHQTTLNHFGPLGPAFRGRDNVTTQTMSPFTLIGLLMNNCDLLLTDPSSSVNGDNDDNENDDTSNDRHELRLGRFLSNDDALMKWTIDTLNESRKVRPMTVLPPLVSITVVTHW